jgi:hypothetical protein
MYLDPFNAERSGQAGREAERRAMYARPDAPPLPDEPAPRKGWLATMLGRATAAISARPMPSGKGERVRRGAGEAVGSE